MWKMWKCAVKCGNAVSNYGKPKWKRKYELTLKSLKTNTIFAGCLYLVGFGLKIFQHLLDSYPKEKLTFF